MSYKEVSSYISDVIKRLGRHFFLVNTDVHTYCVFCWMLRPEMVGYQCPMPLILHHQRAPILCVCSCYLLHRAKVEKTQHHVSRSKVFKGKFKHRIDDIFFCISATNNLKRSSIQSKPKNYFLKFYAYLE